MSTSGFGLVRIIVFIGVNESDEESDEERDEYSNEGGTGGKSEGRRRDEFRQGDQS